MKKIEKVSEATIAEGIITWLKESGHEVWEEVCPLKGSGRCDIVAKSNGIVWAIEVKNSLNFEVINQAYNWLFHAHKVSIAVPYCSTWRKNNQIIRAILKQSGIGLILINKTWRYTEDFKTKDLFEIIEEIKPHFNRKIDKILLNMLQPELQKFGKAGTQSSDYYTPFRMTCDNLKTFLRNHPNSTMKEIVNDIEHHYDSDSCAKASLMQWINKKVIDFIEVNDEVRPYTFTLKEEFKRKD